MSTKVSIPTRWEIVSLYKQHNITQRQLAKQFKCAQTTISHILKVYKKTKQVIDRPRSGRPNKLNRHHKKSLTQALYRETNVTSEELRNNLQRATGINVSSRTIRNQRRRSGFYRVKEKIKFKLTKTNKKKRLEFCRKYINDNLHMWGYSDEKIFPLQKTSNLCWIRSNSQIPIRKVNNLKIQFMVWGCVWYNGRSELHFYETNVNSQTYINTLKECLLPSIPSSTRFQLIQDNARPHTAPNTMKWMNEFGINVIKDWPPYSPDLNAIELVWSWMSNYVKSRLPTTKEELKTAIQLAWENCTQLIIQNFIDHVYHIMQRVIEAEGDYVQ
jgi:transposase